MPSKLIVSYDQIAVFGSAIENPFNMWTDSHVAQGFSWRPDSAAFRILSEVDEHSIDFAIKGETIEVEPDVIIAVEVPFTVPADGRVTVASIGDELEFSSPPGRYQLLYRCALGGKVRLNLHAGAVHRFRIHRLPWPMPDESRLVLDTKAAI